MTTPSQPQSGSQATPPEDPRPAPPRDGAPTEQPIAEQPVAEQPPAERSAADGSVAERSPAGQPPAAAGTAQAPAAQPAPERPASGQQASGQQASGQQASGQRDTLLLAPERRTEGQPAKAGDPQVPPSPPGPQRAQEQRTPGQQAPQGPAASAQVPPAQQPDGQPAAGPSPAAPGPYGQAPAPVPPQPQPQPHAQPPQPYGAQPQQGHPGHGAPSAHGGYASPIPVRDAHLGHALAAEWTKIRSVRSTVWTLAVLAFLVFGIGFLINVFTDDGDYGLQPPISNGLFGLMLGQICVITLGVLVITSEYGTGLIRTTLTAAPRRSRVLTAKVLVFLAVSWTVTTAVCTLTALMGAALHSGPEVASADGGEWAGATVLSGLYVSLLGLLALAVGTLLRHSAGAITVMLGVVLLPAIIPAFLMFSESMRPAAEKILEYNAINSLAALHGVNDSGDGLSQLLLLAVVTAVALAGAYAALEKRDV